MWRIVRVNLKSGRFKSVQVQDEPVHIRDALCKQPRTCELVHEQDAPVHGKFELVQNYRNWIQ
ncbi:hypothetical protein L195_g028133 [Trifolium pratense]|uniref:Uncharacterized protein n=1 Tax=Trifolium pratense TaxID=57577 RepID=A0A2K3L143_TRIPR|nr:hypothetical protein L195_g028133 [Trifolium pratense]